LPGIRVPLQTKEKKIGLVIGRCLKQISNDVKCTYECQEVSNTALHNFPRPQTFKEEPGLKKNLSPGAGFEPTTSGLDHRELRGKLGAGRGN